MNATYEVKEKNNKWHDKVRLLTDDIERGRDELGMCFFLENGNIFWIGSILDINEARDLYDNKINEYLNATNVQVVGGYFSGFMYLVELANNKMFRGLMCPDDLPHEKIWEISSPFLGPFIFMQVEDWVPHSYKDEYLQETKRDKNWQFYNFLVKM
jgi:homospermidine synthase